MIRQLWSCFERSCLAFGSPKRRVSHRGIWCGETVEGLESLTLLSASAVVATVPEALGKSDKVGTAAKPPSDYSGLQPLTGSLGAGTADITQNGAAVTVVLNFPEHPEYAGLTLEGTVKGRKLKSFFEGDHNGISKAVFKAKMFNDGSFKWTLSDKRIN